ncbi:prephenate dehydratase [Ponticaulis profundi]|uniref:prephenate dehydratase n=1 Tax=Ponticaulis profundi TaxID=2665222 RepID=A0ABW1SAV2_9PROT
MAGKIAYQGERGANSEIACKEAFPHLEAIPHRTFEDVFNAVENGQCDLAMIPVENTIAGRVADIHHLLPDTTLSIIGEHYLRIRFQLMALPGAKLEDIKRAKSHVMALGQCRSFLREHGIEAVVAADTAGAARQVAEAGDPAVAAIAPALASDVYGLDILAENIEDADHNTTRFLIMRPEPNDLMEVRSPCVTSLFFTVRNVPAALYKGLGGFATNGVNVTKLESYLTGGSFTAAQFYAEFEGHPDERPVQLALEELGFFSTQIKVLGVFPRATRKPD